MLWVCDYWPQMISLGTMEENEETCTGEIQKPTKPVPKTLTKPNIVEKAEPLQGLVLAVVATIEDLANNPFSLGSKFQWCVTFHSSCLYSVAISA